MSHGRSSKGSGGSHLDKVQQFVVYLYEHMREKNINETRSMYNRSFYKLSEMYFKESPWPQVEEIADFVDSDPVFCLLYQELYYRHIYAALTPSVLDRTRSWEIYCRLFQAFLGGNLSMLLPNEWLWDMIDEFLYQFQTYHQFKGKPSRQTPDEKAMIKRLESAPEKIWDIRIVVHYLQTIVDTSEIEDYLRSGGEAELFLKEGYNSHSNILPVLGYASLIGLSRVYALIGDYGGALSILSPLKTYEPNSLFARKIPGCFITLFYYMGFSYFMTKRYVDSAKCMNSVLLYLPMAKEAVFDRTKLSQLERKEEQICQLLSVLVALCPRTQKQYLDDRVADRLMENYADKVQSMRRGNITAYDELFSAGCPRFINTNSPDFKGDTDTNQQSYVNQLKLFLEDVKQSIALPDLFQYMQLYSSISLDKLASLLNTDPDSVRMHLMCFKNRQYARVNTDQSADLLSGKFYYAGLFDFYLDVDLDSGVEYLIVEDKLVKKSHSQTMIRHIHKFQDIMRDLRQLNESH